MTIDDEVDSLIERVAALPDEAQEELLQSLFMMRSGFLGVDELGNPGS